MESWRRDPDRRNLVNVIFERLNIQPSDVKNSASLGKQERGAMETNFVTSYNGTLTIARYFQETLIAHQMPRP